MSLEEFGRIRHFFQPLKLLLRLENLFVVLQNVMQVLKHDLGADTLSRHLPKTDSWHSLFFLSPSLQMHDLFVPCVFTPKTSTPSIHTKNISMLASKSPSVILGYLVLLSPWVFSLHQFPRWPRYQMHNSQVRTRAKSQQCLTLNTLYKCREQNKSLKHIGLKPEVHCLFDKIWTELLTWDIKLSLQSYAIVPSKIPLG